MNLFLFAALCHLELPKQASYWMRRLCEPLRKSKINLRSKHHRALLGRAQQYFGRTIM